MAHLRVDHNPDQGTTDTLSHPFVVFVNENTKPRYRLTTEEAYALFKSLQWTLRMPKDR